MVKQLTKEQWEEQRIEYACQQFQGFTHAKKGFNVYSLASAMGLQKEEWDIIKKRSDDGLNYLDVDDCEELDEYFSSSMSSCTKSD